MWTSLGARFIVTERRENRVSACVGLFAVTVSLIFAVITERLERVFVGRSFLLDSCAGNWQKNMKCKAVLLKCRN
jgi:hypothetical protein